MAIVDFFGVLLPLFAVEVIVGEIIVAVLIATALFLAITHRGRYHHWVLPAAYFIDVLLVKPIMISRITTGVFGSFPYFNTLGFPHVMLAILTAALGAVTIYLGFRFRIYNKKNKKMYLKAKGRIHRFFGAAFVVSWAITLAYGLRIAMTFYGLFRGA